ncbi:hypothetical protein ODZ84_01865 [Chryseobacterium fluminis]|nr:JAB-like toxin 1 domain-containing protein [Chryseobacterium sp. MMS21-Ot14]UZU00254.1 hypothetical protein ODZ84_01865 [Chryseobacterium sp. MMS21-Ot14]
MKYDYIKFGGNTEGAQQFFNYVAENTSVEFNRNIFTNNRNDKFNFVGTSYKEDKVPLVHLGATLEESEHSHPDANTFWPSGLNVYYNDSTGKFRSDQGIPTGDVITAKENPNTKFLLYAPNYSGGALRLQYNNEKVISITNQGKK